MLIVPIGRIVVREAAVRLPVRSLNGMATVLAVERWCPSCDKLFRATLTVEGHGKESTRIESPCPDCGDAGAATAEVGAPLAPKGGDC